MSIPVHRYLDIVDAELERGFAADGEGLSARSLRYLRRVLDLLRLRLGVLPALERGALEQYDRVLDELCAQLHDADEGMALIAELVTHVRAQPDYARAAPCLQTAVRILADRDTPSSRHLLARIAGISHDLSEAFNRETLRARGERPLDAAAAPALDAGKTGALRDYLRRVFPRETTLEVAGARVVPGGGSKQTLFVDLCGTRELPATVVLRMDRADGIGADVTVVDEYHLFEILFELGLPVPRPFAAERDAAVLGAPFIVVSRLPGGNIGDWLDVDEPSRDFALDLARVLATLHAVPPERVGDRLPGATGSVRERFEQDLRKYEASWRASGQPSIAMEQAVAWLKRNIAAAEGRRALIHCDVGAHNMLGSNGRLTALLDWETAVIGNPAQDLTYVRPTVEQMLPWEDFLRAYEDAGGTVPGPLEMDFYELWRNVWILYFLIIARSYIGSGLSGSLIHAYGAEQIYQATEHRLHVTVKRLYANGV